MITVLRILINLRTIRVSGVSLEDYYLKNDKRQLAMKKCARQLEEEGFGVRPLDLLKIKMKFIKDHTIAVVNGLNALPAHLQAPCDKTP